MILRTVALALLALRIAPAHATPPVTYRIAFDPAATALNAETCTAEAAAYRSFGADHDDALRYISQPMRSSGGALERKDDRFVARDWRAGECFRYRIDLDAIASRKQMEAGLKAGGDLLTSASLWLWRPRGLANERDAEITFKIPDGWSLSVPWAPLDDPPHRRFRVGATPGVWPTMVAIGHFKEEQTIAGEGRVRTAILGNLDADTQDKLRAFVSASANDVALTMPKVFTVAPQLLLIPTRGRSEAVPFGLSVRGGAQGIMVLVNPDAPAADFMRAWTLTHEFVHVAHPHMGADGRWISEGIATYYQNVLRARTGRLSPQQAWDELDAGFDRGRADKSDLTLASTSEEMDEGHHYMRGYWSGAALMLRADVALRTRKENPTTLDAALNAYLACCRAGARGAEVDDFIANLDRATGGHEFATLYRELANSADFPDLSPAYTSLGIRSAKDHVQRAADPRAVALRMGIMSAD